MYFAGFCDPRTIEDVFIVVLGSHIGASATLKLSFLPRLLSAASVRAGLFACPTETSPLLF